MIGICSYIDDRSGPLFAIPQGALAWQPIMGKIGNTTIIRQAAAPKRQAKNGSFNKNIFNGNIVATSCANMVKIGPITPEIARVTTAPFWTRRRKSAYPTKYLSNH